MATRKTPATNKTAAGKTSKAGPAPSPARKAVKKAVTKKPAAKKQAAKEAATKKPAAAQKIAARTSLSRKAAAKAAPPATTGKPAKQSPKTAVTPKKTASVVVARRVPAKAVKPMASSARASDTGKPAVAQAAAAAPAKVVRAAAGTRKPRGRITPEQALANTRALLKAKQEHDRQPPPWQALDGMPGAAPQAGFQSDEAAQKATELHAGESRMQAIQGSVGTQGRHAQGKRDKR